MNPHTNKTTHTKKSTHTTAEQSPGATEEASLSLESAPAAATPPHHPTATHAAVAPAPSAAPATPVIFIKPPPPSINIPSVPDGFVPTAGANYRGILPKKEHMAAIPDVLEELGRFTDYTEVFGKTAPPFESVKQTLTAAGQWTLTRKKLRAFDLFCRTQEGLAWKDARAKLDNLTPAFNLATNIDSTVGTRYPGFARLLSAGTGIAKKGVSTRKGNTKLESDGKEPYKGGVGKKRRRAAEKAILEAHAAAQAAGATPVAPTAVATTAAAVATGAGATVAAATPVVTGATAPVAPAGGTGGAHS